MSREQYEVEVLADSISPNGDRITTFKLKYPRFIHSELMTHRQFSRNASSSRAIPVNRTLSYILKNMAKPTHWGVNRSGMTAAREEHENRWIGKVLWKTSCYFSVATAWLMAKAGFHKQIVNRITEPFTHINVIVTATDWENFFDLRCHEDAQPEIRELASYIHMEYCMSIPNKLEEGEWHLPFINRVADWKENKRYFSLDDETEYTLEEALMVSVSCCCQISYRKEDQSLIKAETIFNMLTPKDSPPHASPFEHQATPISVEEIRVRENCKAMLQAENLPEKDAEQMMYSANFKGWRSYRRVKGL
jgi:hypothetical protein